MGYIFLNNLQRTFFVKSIGYFTRYRAHLKVNWRKSHHFHNHHASYKDSNKSQDFFFFFFFLAIAYSRSSCSIEVMQPSTYLPLKGEEQSETHFFRNFSCLLREKNLMISPSVVQNPHYIPLWWAAAELKTVVIISTLFLASCKGEHVIWLLYWRYFCGIQRICMCTDRKVNSICFFIFVFFLPWSL